MRTFYADVREFDLKLFLEVRKHLPGGEVNDMLQRWVIKEEHERRSIGTSIMQAMAKSVVAETNLPLDVTRLTAHFEALERVTRSMSEVGPERLRDHFNHSIRDLMFALYLRDRLGFESVRTQDIILASIVHDMAYPIERFKRRLGTYINMVTHALLGAEAHVSIGLKEPDQLLALLHRMGEQNDPDMRAYYKHIVFEGLAGVGLFQTRHYVSGSILLWLLVSDEMQTSTFWRSSAARHLLGIATAIALHGRDVYPWRPPTQLDFILRFTDELQEWQRDLHNAVSEPLINSVGQDAVRLTFGLSPAEYDAGYPDRRFDINLFVANKIAGIAPVAKVHPRIALEYKFDEGTHLQVDETSVRSHVERYKWLTRSASEWPPQMVWAGDGRACKRMEIRFESGSVLVGTGDA